MTFAGRAVGVSLCRIVQALYACIDGKFVVRRRSERARAFFVIMNEVPMAAELDTASANPMYLSSTIEFRSASAVVTGNGELEKVQPGPRRGLTSEPSHGHSASLKNGR